MCAWHKQPNAQTLFATAFGAPILMEPKRLVGKDPKLKPDDLPVITGAGGFIGGKPPSVTPTCGTEMLDSGLQTPEQHTTPEFPPTPKIRGHVPVLDGLRGVAILLVLMVHFYQKPLISDAYPTITNILSRIVDVGRFGVEMFFVLSGFLITGILLDTKRQTGFFRKFYMRRILRIFPLYYGALAIVLLALPHLVQFDPAAKHIASNQVWLWTYLANWPALGWIWDDSSLFLLGHFWSLSVEEHFYFVWPSLVASFPGRTLGAICVFLVGVGLLSRAVTAFAGTNAPIVFQWTTLQRVDGLAVGAFIATAFRNPSLANFLPKRRLFWCLFAAISALVSIYQCLPRKWDLAFFVPFQETLVVGLFGLILLYALRSAPAQASNRILSSKVLVAFGKYSYGLYVIHGILRPCFARLFDFGKLPKHWGLPFVYLLAYYVLTIALSFCLAYLIYHLFEKRFLALKRYFEYDRNSVTYSENVERAPLPVHIRK